MVNVQKLKKDVKNLYTAFRAQQLCYNKEIITQIEEVDFLEKVLISMENTRNLLRTARLGKIKSYIGSIYSRSKTFF